MWLLNCCYVQDQHDVCTRNTEKSACLFSYHKQLTARISFLHLMKCSGDLSHGQRKIHFIISVIIFKARGFLFLMLLSKLKRCLTFCVGLSARESKWLFKVCERWPHEQEGAREPPDCSFSCNTLTSKVRCAASSNLLKCLPHAAQTLAVKKRCARFVGSAPDSCEKP